MTDFSVSDLGGGRCPNGVATSERDENPVTVMVTDPELGRFVLKVTVFYDGEIFLHQLEIQVQVELSSPPPDRVRVKPTPSIAGAALNGCELSSAFGVDQRVQKQWEMFEVTEVTPLGKNYTKTNCFRSGEFSVSAPFSRMILDDGLFSTETNVEGLFWSIPVWTDGLGDELKVEDPGWWLDPDEVDLYVYNYTGDVDVQTAMNLQLETAKGAQWGEQGRHQVQYCRVQGRGLLRRGGQDHRLHNFLC